MHIPFAPMHIPARETCLAGWSERCRETCADVARRRARTAGDRTSICFQPRDPVAELVQRRERCTLAVSVLCVAWYDPQLLSNEDELAVQERKLRPSVGSVSLGLTHYRGTSLISPPPPPLDHHRTLGMVLL